MSKLKYRIPKVLMDKVIPLAERLTKKNQKDTLKAICKILETQNYSDATKSVNYSKVKKLFKDYTSDATFLKEIRPDPILTAKLFKDNKERLKRVKLLNIDKETIIKILSFRNSKRDVFKLFIFLLFVTGRRVSELMYSDITLKPKSNDLTISHILKRNDKNQYLSFPPIVSPKIVLRALDDFKSAFLYTNPNTFNKNVNAHIKRHFGSKFHSHVLRKMYAIYLYQFRNEDEMTINPFLQKVLLQQTLTSSFFYTGIKYSFNTDIAK